jgi:hypothetical protein
LRRGHIRTPNPRDEGVLSGAVDVRSDLLRRLRASSRLTLAIVEFELAWAPDLLSTMDYTYRERHGEAIYRFKGLPSRRRGDGRLPSDFFRRNVVLSFQEDAIGVRLPPP